MWHLTSIHASNLCSFLDLDYRPKQGEATLIFGNNLDSDSQNSNGSGKSALIEAIAIALTGEPLRKVNTDEIINDAKDEAVVSAVLSNDSSGVQMTINRKLSRKQPQVVQIICQNGPYDSDTEEIVQATVADYNKYILDQLGLTKDDIFANYILTARKYKSFLASSDKEKKELINRFSNGVLVDQSIEAIQQDMDPILKEWNEAEKRVVICTGRVEALAAEIEKAVNEAENRRATTESRIRDWKNLIADKRAEMRRIKDAISKIEDSMEGLNLLDSAMQELEQSDANETKALSKINAQFHKNDIALATNFYNEIDALNFQLEMAHKEVKFATENVGKLKSALDLAEAEFTEGKVAFDKKNDTIDSEKRQCDARIQELGRTAQRLQSEIEQAHNAQIQMQKEAAQWEQQLAGVIQCPKCRYEFALNASVDINEARKTLATIKSKLDKLADTIEEQEANYQQTITEGKKQRQLSRELDQEEAELHKTLANTSRKHQEARQEYIKCESQIEQAESRLIDVQNKINRIRKRLFDEVFETIDDVYKQRESNIKRLEEDLEVAKGSIAAYEKAIEDAQNIQEEDIMASFKASQKEYQQQLTEAGKAKKEIEGQLNELRSQEATFVEFKTYLANTKINAIAQITNEFLETIGSDIRVALSGYTILKSGKIRDKISVSLLRDGVDCGSFEKFSAGERVRVELASILSMNELTNLNCEDGKGLDLLIADEVLDSADEQGLASVFEALNKTQITSLVVSHGLIHESYPNKILVTKSNGISFIDEAKQYE